jgi:acyl-CoA synthetase (AMP-forming)/AMP-acid ligase II
MPRFVVQLLRQTRITCWYSVPSILTGMLQDGGFADGSNACLRLVLFAGEVLASAHAARLLAAVPKAACVNLYGPTETNVVSWYTLPPAIDTSQSIPIGKACPYAELRVDESNGELLAAGESLMTGYCNLSEETARAFALLEGKRYYRTGDRVTLGSDGNYTFVGRLDRQVKRRGFRIELGEIEAALGRHCSVVEAAAVALRTESHGTVITVFIRMRAGEALSPIEVKAYCANALPSYMLPDRIAFVDAIPRGSRGKIDYEALERAAGEPGHGH